MTSSTVSVGSPTLMAMVEHGAALADQGRFAEADPLLRDGAEWMLEIDPPAMDELWLGLDPLITAVRGTAEFYEAWHSADPESGHDERARAWRELLREVETQRTH